METGGAVAGPGGGGGGSRCFLFADWLVGGRRLGWLVGCDAFRLLLRPSSVWCVGVHGAPLLSFPFSSVHSQKIKTRRRNRPVDFVLSLSLSLFLTASAKAVRPCPRPAKQKTVAASTLIFRPISIDDGCIGPFSGRKVFHQRVNHHLSYLGINDFRGLRYWIVEKNQSLQTKSDTIVELCNIVSYKAVTPTIGLIMKTLAQTCLNFWNASFKKLMGF